MDTYILKNFIESTPVHHVPRYAVFLVNLRLTMKLMAVHFFSSFVAFRVFLFFSNPASPISPVHSLCLSVGVCGTSPSLRV